LFNVGTIFIDTLHQDSEYANVAAIAKKIAQMVLLKPKVILNSPKKNCDQLSQTTNNSSDVSGRARIFSFYETQTKI
jgi:hypothetical protein